MEQHPHTPPLMRRMFDMFEGRESPYSYVRMSTYAMVATAMARRMYLPYGSKLLYPNLYVVLVGEPATKKTTVITTCKRMLTAAGVKDFSPNHMSRLRLVQGLAINAFNRDNEVTRRLAGDVQADYVKLYGKTQTMLDLAKKAGVAALNAESPFRKISEAVSQDLTDIDLDGIETEVTSSALESLTNECNSASMYMDELVDGANQQAKDLWVTVTALWDGNPYVDTSGIVIPRPCVNMLAGINPASFCKVFPNTEMQSGLITRLILVHGTKTGRQLAPFDFNAELNMQCELDIIKHLHELREMSGEMSIDEDAKVLLRKIMATQPKVQDSRFDYYYDRRLDHLMKMVMAHAAMWGRYTITRDDVLFCNTALTANEWRMSDALGSYGLNPIVKLADLLLRQLRDYVLTPEGAATAGGMQRSALYNVMKTSTTSQVDFANAIAHLMTSGQITQEGELFFANTVTLAHLTRLKGSILDPSMCVEWDML